MMKVPRPAAASGGFAPVPLRAWALALTIAASAAASGAASAAPLRCDATPSQAPAIAPPSSPPAKAHGRRGARDLRTSSVETLAAANAAARQRPQTTGFQQARQIYTYASGGIYELYANPSYITTILLEPGERLNEIAAGDTSRWMVQEASTETELDGRTVVLVKPQGAGLRTNIVLVTDRRTYTIEAVSQAGAAYSAQVAWCYPDPFGAGAAHAAAGPLNSDYKIRTVRGRPPHWTPSRVTDDGRRTWIEFPGVVAATDMPPLFVITGEGAELVNYRVQGERFVVDRVFDVAELRLGTRAPVIVRLERNREAAKPAKGPPVGGDTRVLASRP